ncbi:aconitase/3-isopropylmalate dehydratase large subunit family protein [Proteinivorax hydrogeniformans]|uniref:Aconitase/3-isopropylmalate dehydratase large subunit family protein n=1 Tax=Proteinivorax hydrogeniformans TaxID=1826727 RepID=A0AAU8HUH6_9FIRM
MNIIEKIIAQKANKDFVKVGDEVTISVDLAIAHDVTAPMAIKQFKSINIDRVFNKDKVAFVMDHCIPCSTVESREQHNYIKEFSNQFGVKLFDKSEGVIHQVLREEKLCDTGDVVVGADSHTCTAGAYGALALPVGSTELAAVMALGTIDIEVPQTHLIKIEGQLKKGVYAKDIILHVIGKFGTNGFTDKGVIFTGETILNLTVEEKMTIANMMIEKGAMIGYIDQEKEMDTEKIGEVSDITCISAEDIKPVAACPSSPANIKPVEEIEGTKINQVVVGSCTNGRYSDMEIIANVLKDRKASDDVTLIVVPASKKVLDKMEENGLCKIIRDAGAIIINPGCGPCFGAHQGLLNKGDVAITTTNRNFPGRMGHKDAKIYLASPRVVAESAVKGYIVRPGTVIPLEV